MPAALAVGGWFASAAINKLADKARDYLEGQYEYQAGVEDNLKKLQRKLTLMQAVIHEAEQGKIQNPSLKTWLRDLKDAAFDAEDLLDKFDYQLLEAKVEEQNKVRGSFASSSRNIATHAKTFVKRLVFRDDDLNKLYEIVKSFDDISSDMGHFLVLMKNDGGGNKQHETSEWRQTTSIPVEPEIVGRRIEINNIVNSLVRRTDNSRSSNEIFSVLSIVGIGGVGKTTVAQHVFNNNEIKEHFNPKIWLCVSETFDVRRLTIEMIDPTSRLMSMDLHASRNLDKIQGILKEDLKGKRFLIVLDDMWNEMRTNWETLCKPFKFGQEGSKIIVTTRSHKVAATVGTKEMVNLEGLAEEDYWTFFKQCAFGDENPEDHPKLELIGPKIAKKLGGLPLAAKTVGSILNSELEEEHWRGVLESKLWEIDQPEDGIMPALKLSYEHLQNEVKQCFAYCSLFPKDYLYDKEKLVQLWMAQGFVPHHEERKGAEDIGVKYFDYLLQRCFFQKADVDKDGYKIHDLLHDLAESVIDDECCRIETDRPIQIPKRARHLYIATKHQLEICENMCDIKKLRSLVVDELSIQDPSNSGLIDFIQYILEESKQLRTLIFYNLPFNISLEAIGDLIHLRYLEIEFWGKLNLPVCKLYHLQVLNQSIFLPNHLLLKDVNNCIDLRHLNKGLSDFSKVYGIGKLTCLQELVDYYVGEEYGHEIGQLRNMRQLRGSLSIHNLDYVKNKEAASEAMLHNKEHLKFLGLRWNYYAEDLKADVCNEIIEELRPHTNLKELKIDGYMGVRSPSWLSKTWLSKLEFIRLEFCNAWKVLPPLGQLPFLKFLYLEGMSSIKKVGTEFYGSDADDTAFPSLEELKFEHMNEWEEWSGPEKGQLLFPRLRRLGIYGCRKLRRTLVLPTSFKEVQLLWWGHSCSKIISDDVPSSSMLEICIDYNSQQFFWCLSKEVLASIQYLNFDGHNHITSFTENEEEWFQNLTSLKKLIFIRCRNLQSFPANMRSLSSLKRLKVIECPNIERLPEKGLPISLEELHIKTCKKLEMQCQMSDGQDWLKISHIPRIVIEGIKVRWPEYE